MQAVKEADAAVEQATRNKTKHEGDAREANARVQESIENLNKLQQSQSNAAHLALQSFPALPRPAFASRCLSVCTMLLATLCLLSSDTMD